ncbi:MAG: hypothetical protein JRG76_17110 [Deltaproteobacteria bacterium]|nr:hypothetical protein [Deltaproteobacteria bacterium]
MTRTALLLLVSVALACGGSDAVPEDSAGSSRANRSAQAPPSHDNAPPVVDSVELAPETPGVGDTMSVAIRALDPDGDRIDIEVEWYRNGALEQSGPQTRLATNAFRRGDRIWAEVWVSDRDSDVHQRTETVELSNRVPDLVAVRVIPPKATGGDTLIAEARAIDRDGDAYEFAYRWYVNGKLLPGQGASSLEPGQVKRGDEVEIEVSAKDEGGSSDWVRSPVLEIRNAAPMIRSKPSEATAAEGRYLYQVKAEDPDGDRPLRYMLGEGPEGLRVDLISGAVSWNVPSDKGGSFPIEIVVSDPLGASSRQQYVLELSWQSTPAKPAASDPSDDLDDLDDADDADE